MLIFNVIASIDLFHQLTISLSLYIYMYVCVFVRACVCVCVCVCADVCFYNVPVVYRPFPSISCLLYEVTVSHQ